MEKIADDLYCAMSVIGNTRKYCYFVKRKQGNVLLHGLDRKKYRAIRDTLTQLGGVQHQLMCHWHEAKGCDLTFYEEHAPQLHVPELERAIICKLLGPSVQVTTVPPGKRLLRDFIPYHVAGQTPGFTVYQWRDFIFGSDFMVRYGDNWVSYFGKDHVQAGLGGLASLKRVRATHWLPGKSTGPARVPFEFDHNVITSVEEKLRKKWKVRATDPTRAQR